MSLFLVVTADPQTFETGCATYHALSQAGQLLTGHEPASKHETENSWISIFPRTNGSSPHIALDAKSGNWLLSAGQWFHNSGYGCGQEQSLLQRCAEIGIQKLTRELEGFFAIVHGSEAEGKINVLTDAIGSFHCFTRTWPGVTAISSSSLLLASAGDGVLDPVALNEFLCTGVVYESRTLYQDVRKLGPASRFLFQNGKLQSVHRYWDIKDLSLEPLRGGTAVNCLGEAVVAAGKKISTAYARPLCDLTGGFDSRALLASLMKAEMPIATVVTGPEQSADVRISKELANLKGLPHIHLNPEPTISVSELAGTLPLTDGECDALEYSRVLKVHKCLSEKFDISLNGSFGELARGYWWELLFPHLGASKEIDAAKVARLRFAAGNFDPNLFPNDTNPNLANHFAEVIKRTNQGLESAPNNLQMDNLYLMMRMQCWQGRIASSTDRIWPCLSPFMFRSVLEVILQTDPGLRRRGLFIRKYLASVDKQLAEFPLEHGYPALPVSIGTFHRFWPIVPLYAGKAFRKALSKAGVRTTASHLPSGIPPRLKLWQDQNVQNLLSASNMRIGSVLRLDRLDSFLRRSKQAAFPYDAQWARILTVEAGLQKLDEMRRSIRQPLFAR